MRDIQMTEIPVFTTSLPGFMGSTEDRNVPFINKHTKARKLDESVIGISTYIDGELEDILGYDIPIWLSGNITGDTQTVYVWNVAGTIMYKAELTYGHEGTIHKHAYIRLPGGVTHEK